MSEVLRELVVALSLDSDNFSRNMRTINHQIKEAESTFRLAGAGIDKFEKSVDISCCSASAPRATSATPRRARSSCGVIASLRARRSR
jgi:hypothetical protein